MEALSLLRVLQAAPLIPREVLGVCGRRFYGSVVLIGAGTFFAFHTDQRPFLLVLGLYVFLFVLWGGAITVYERFELEQDRLGHPARIGTWFATAGTLAAVAYATDFAAAALGTTGFLGQPGTLAGRWVAWFGAVFFLPATTILLGEFLVHLPYGRRRQGRMEVAGLLLTRLGAGVFLLAQVFEGKLLSYGDNKPPLWRYLPHQYATILLWIGALLIAVGLGALLGSVVARIIDLRGAIDRLVPEKARAWIGVVDRMTLRLERCLVRGPTKVTRIVGWYPPGDAVVDDVHDERRRLSWFLYAITLFTLTLPLWVVESQNKTIVLLLGAYAVFVFPWSASRAMERDAWPGSRYRRAFVLGITSLVVGIMHHFLDVRLGDVLEGLLSGALLALIATAILSQSAIRGIEEHVDRLFSFLQPLEEAIQETQRGVARAEERLARAEARSMRAERSRATSETERPVEDEWLERVAAVRASLRSIDESLGAIHESHHGGDEGEPR